MADQAKRNGHTENLVGEELFELLLRLEIQKAVRLQYCVSVACFAPDLPRDEIESTLPRRLAEAAIRVLRGTDVATTLVPPSVGLLLIDADTHDVRQILHRATEAAGSLAGQGRRIALSGGATCFPETTTSVRELLPQALDLMERARADGGDRLYLPS